MAIIALPLTKGRDSPDTKWLRETKEFDRPDRSTKA
jgi:hypothetical protein